jgi:hypothetical protein
MYPILIDILEWLVYVLLSGYFSVKVFWNNDFIIVISNHYTTDAVTILK